MSDPSLSPEFYAFRICSHYGKSVEMWIRVGDELLLAKSKLPHGEFGRMFKCHPRPIAKPLPFRERTAQMFMAIASNEVLSNPHHGSVLPANWRTLAELATLPGEVLKAGIASGQIHAEMERSEVAALQSGETRKTESWSLEDALNRVNLAINAEIRKAPVDIHAMLARGLCLIAEELARHPHVELLDAVAIAKDELDIHDTEPGGYKVFDGATVIASCKSTHAPWYRSLTTYQPGRTALKRRQIEARLDDIEAGQLPTKRTAQAQFAVVWAIKDLARTSPLSRGSFAP